MTWDIPSTFFVKLLRKRTFSHTVLSNTNNENKCRDKISCGAQDSDVVSFLFLFWKRFLRSAETTVSVYSKPH